MSGQNKKQIKELYDLYGSMYGKLINENFDQSYGWDHPQWLHQTRKFIDSTAQILHVANEIFDAYDDEELL